ncbi:Echinoderm microtubule-associated protein-like 1 [Dissostichus eleginoides]|uniref:Echinoderm microtubule-associated protein-like 1 n=1 Tax=Dissostichus eleginoides TaxID=100907 RepID=A0AAD9C5N0_DISEL|nr:Echinoderm microtubule-associated protein-like 1 [Dissostichus eleginoides]
MKKGCFKTKVSDDSASAASSMEVTDRIASLEQRVQMQEDEIQLLKSALADVVRRLNVSEEQQAMGSRRGPTKDPPLMRKAPSAHSNVGKSARPMIATLPLRPTVNNGTIVPKKGALPSPGSGSRKDGSSIASKRILYLPLSTVRRANSNEHVGTLSRKDSVTPRATELGLDPPAATPAGKEVTANRGTPCSMQVRTGGTCMAL